MERTTLFVDVILPLAIPNLYTYRLPYELNGSIKTGQRVVVNFGKNKLYTALVRNIHENPPKKYEAKYIECILDVEPIVKNKQFELWDWMAAYYMCCIGEVMNAALPSGLKLSSETKIVMHPEYLFLQADSKSPQALTDTEYLIVEALELRNVLTISDIEQIANLKIVHSLITSLIDKKAIIIYEELKEKFKAKVESYIRFTEESDKEENLKIIFDSLEKKAFKQLELVMTFVKLSNRYTDRIVEVKKSDLLKNADASPVVLNELVRKNIFEVYDRVVGRLSGASPEGSINELNEDQNTAFEKTKLEFQTKDVVLLHGVTSSGKTELYIEHIAEIISTGKQVLYLLPEIALTMQIINRLRKRFGNRVGVYHSKFNENERVEVWNGVLNCSPENHHQIPGLKQQPTFDIVLGARSAVFLPFDNLGLVIVDEEHDTSYKQFDPSPRYNARDTAIFLASIHKAKTLLGSATPCIESYYNAQENKYGFVELTKRFGGVQMPEILVADVKEATRKKLMKSHYSPLLLEAIQTALNKKEQVILFQNRRGFAPMLECDLCAWTPQCINCDVSLTYHKNINSLRCHYCGYSVKTPSVCEACGDNKIVMKGFGTEKIEEDLAVFFPEARILRMDFDTTRSKYGYQQIIADFEERKVNILVGTQMVTKGLDFDNVSLVGILNADSMLNFPDFRSFERSFQLMAQVSGRAGRKDKRGQVIIQSHHPNHAIIKNVIENDYKEMYHSQLLDRKKFLYPPFFRLIEINLKHKEISALNDAANYLANKLRSPLGNRVLGPEFPMIVRVRNLYQKNILLKIEREISMMKIKQLINEHLSEFKDQTQYKSVRIALDVDTM